jgi:putative transposase
VRIKGDATLLRIKGDATLKITPMPRVARQVFANVPHHITQRGNRREDVFFCDEDKELYLAWLVDYCDKHTVTIIAYCLMDNHVHLILTPLAEDSLVKVLKPLHMRYAQYINKQKGWTGHLWQGRFFSSALDEAHTQAGIRYVERNPVAASMVKKAENYKWSSAAHHCGLADNKALLNKANQLTDIAQADWADWLSEPENLDLTKVLERNIEKGLPCGSDSFISMLEKQVKRNLQFRPQGRPEKG